MNYLNAYRRLLVFGLIASLLMKSAGATSSAAVREALERGDVVVALHAARDGAVSLNANQAKRLAIQAQQLPLSAPPEVRWAARETAKAGFEEVLRSGTNEQRLAVALTAARWTEKNGADREAWTRWVALAEVLAPHDPQVGAARAALERAKNRDAARARSHVELQRYLSAQPQPSDPIHPASSGPGGR